MNPDCFPKKVGSEDLEVPHDKRLKPPAANSGLWR